MSEDKYPVPNSDEEWEIIDKYETYEEGYHKYCVLVNSTNIMSQEQTLKRVSSLYKQDEVKTKSKKLNDIVTPNGLLPHIYGMTQEEIRELIILYNDNVLSEEYNTLMIPGVSRSVRRNMRHKVMVFVQNYKEVMYEKIIKNRAQLTKFGTKSTNMETTTSVSDKPVFFELTHPDLIYKYSDYHEMFLKNKLSDEQSNQSTIKTISCRICKCPHWTSSCPMKDSMPISQPDIPATEINLNEAQTPLLSKSQGRGSSYVPPHKRNQQGSNNDNSNNDRGDSRGRGGRGGGRSGRGGRGGRGDGRGGGRGDRDDRDKPTVKTIKLTNIAIYTEEPEVKNFCLQYGNIYKFKYNQYKRRDRRTNTESVESITVYITYTRQDNADTALEQLNGLHYDSCLWSAEWAAF